MGDGALRLLLSTLPGGAPTDLRPPPRAVGALTATEARNGRALELTVRTREKRFTDVLQRQLVEAVSGR